MFFLVLKHSKTLFSHIFMFSLSNNTKHSWNNVRRRENASPTTWIRGCKHQLITNKISCFEMSSWAFLGFHVDDDVVCKIYSQFSSGVNSREGGNLIVKKMTTTTTTKTMKVNVEICSNNYRSLIIKLISSLYSLHRDFNLAFSRCDRRD